MILQPIYCPHCHGMNLVKNGKTSEGKQRYLCRESACDGRTFIHTLKTQVIIHQKASQIICLGHGKGRIHDFRLFKNSGIKFGELLKVIADKGYQGINKILN